MDDFKISRKLFSSYYVAILISFFFFQLIKDLIYTWSTWLGSILNSAFNANLTSNTNLWLVFFFVCFLVTFLIRKYLVAGLGFYIDNEDTVWWEHVISFILVFGLYLYLINQVFDQPMPSDTMPTWMIRLVGGYENTFNTAATPIVASNVWSFVPWLWYVGPIAFFYARVKFKAREG